MGIVERLTHYHDFHWQTSRRKPFFPFRLSGQGERRLTAQLVTKAALIFGGKGRFAYEGKYSSGELTNLGWFNQVGSRLAKESRDIRAGTTRLDVERSDSMGSKLDDRG